MTFDIEGKGVLVSVFGESLPKELKPLLRLEDDGICVWPIKFPGTPPFELARKGWQEALVGQGMEKYMAVRVKVETFRVGSLAQSEHGEMGHAQESKGLQRLGASVGKLSQMLAQMGFAMTPGASYGFEHDRDAAMA